MDLKDVNGWKVPVYETKLDGSCRPSMHVKYRDWDKLKALIFNMKDYERHTFVDVGANIGLISVVAKIYFRKVISIEPHPITAECLRQNMANSKSPFGTPTKVFEVIEAAAGTVNGTTILYDPPQINTSGYATMIKHDGWIPQTVKTIFIDSLGLPHCDFLKLDIQGKEADAILGAEQTIRLYKPFMYVEVKEGNDSLKVLEKWGYEIHSRFRAGHVLLHHRTRIL